MFRHGGPGDGVNGRRAPCVRCAQRAHVGMFRCGDPRDGVNERGRQALATAPMCCAMWLTRCGVCGTARSASPLACWRWLQRALVGDGAVIGIPRGAEAPLEFGHRWLSAACPELPPSDHLWSCAWSSFRALFRSGLPNISGGRVVPGPTQLPSQRGNSTREALPAAEATRDSFAAAAVTRETLPAAGSTRGTLPTAAVTRDTLPERTAGATLRDSRCVCSDP